MKKTLAILCLSAFSLPAAESTFSLDFEGQALVAAQSKADPKPVKPADLSPGNFTTGFDGKSGYLPASEYRPTFTANRVVGVPEGSVSFWFKPVAWIPGKPARFLHGFIPGKSKELAIFYFLKGPRGNDLFFRRVLQAGGQKVDVQATLPGKYVDTEAWQQVTCTWSATDLCIYLNGTLADRRAMPPETVSMAAYETAWGSLAVLPVITADGDDPQVRTAIDDVEVFSGALTADEVKARYLKQRPGGPVPKFPAPKAPEARITVTKPLEGCIDIDFPGAAGEVGVRDIGWAQRLSAEECAFMVDASVPVVVRLSSGVFPVKAFASCAVNFSDRPPLYTNADAEGVLSIPLLMRSNYCGVCVAAADARNLIAGAAWTAVADGVTNPFRATQTPCGKATRDTPTAAGREATFKLEKTERDGRLAWESAFVDVKPGKEYLLSGQYRMPESAYGAKIRFQLALQGDGKPERVLREGNLTFFAVPTLGATWRYSQVRAAVPEGYTRAKAMLSIEGSAQVMWWDEVKLREAPRALTLVPRGRPSDDGKAGLSREAVREYWTKRPDRRVRVEAGQGLPWLSCDGQAVPLLWYNTSANLPQHMELKAMLAAGLRVHVVPLTPPNGWWRARESYDFSSVQSNVEAVLEHDPEAIVLLSVEVSPRYLAWGEENPDAVWCDHDGRKLAGYKTTLHKPDRLPPDSKDVWFFSYSAESYRAQAAAALKALAAHLKSFPAGRAISGIMLWAGNDGQWQRPMGDMYEGNDYSPASVLDFRRFLRGQYGNDVLSLRRAWADPRAAFETAVLPTYAERNPDSYFLHPSVGPERRIIDANRYGDEGVAQTIKALGTAIKGAMGKDFLVCSYLHDCMEFGGRSSHKILLESDAIDAIVGIPSYSAYRTIGTVGQVTGALASYALHGKLHLSEFDVRTHVSHLGKDAYTLLHYTHAGAENEAEFAHLMKRDSAMTLTRGAGAWFLCMPYTTFTTPGYRAQVASFARIHSNAAAHPIPADRGQIAVYVDQDLEHVTRAKYSRAQAAMQVSMPIRTAFSRSGVSFDSYMLSDVVHPGKAPYKVHFFLSAATITPAEIRHVKEKLQRDGNVLVFCAGAAQASEAGPFTETLKELCGITVRYDEKTVGNFRTAPIPGSDRMARELKDNGEVLWDQPLWYVDDKGAVGFGRIVGPNRIGWAVRRFPAWTGVYLATPGAITPELIRAIAGEAGLTPIGPCGDVTLAGNGIVALHALSDGLKTLQFPDARKFIDLDLGLALPAAVSKLEFPMLSGETRWFREAESTRK